MVPVASYLLFSIYGGVIAGIIYINSTSRNSEDFYEEGISYISLQYQNHQRMNVNERII